MCDRIILRETDYHSQYICEECFAELKAFKATWPIETIREEVAGKIDSFMNTVPNRANIKFKDDLFEVDQEFDRLTGTFR